jgi:hypothetical protein
MGKAKWTVEALEKHTVSHLRDLCKKHNVPGMSKKRKEVIIEALSAKKSRKRDTASMSREVDNSGEVTAVECNVRSVMTKPGSSSGRISSTIQVSCGASSGEYPVVGKKVGAVAEFLREVLNVPSTPKMLVNGKEVASSYILKDADNVEFMKPSGRKGIDVGL